MIHELEHISARDQVSIVATQVIAILLPWNLPFWWFAHRLRAAIEVDCDARVLRRGVEAAHYGEVLLTVGQRRARLPNIAPALSEPVTQLERRIRIMLMRPTRGSKRRAALTLALTFAIAACTTQIEPPTISTGPLLPTEIDSPRPVIVSNGVEIWSHTIDIRGPGVQLAPGVTSTEDVTLLSGEVLLRIADTTQIRRTSDITSDRFHQDGRRYAVRRQRSFGYRSDVDNDTAGRHRAKRGRKYDHPNGHRRAYLHRLRSGPHELRPTAARSCGQYQHGRKVGGCRRLCDLWSNCRFFIRASRPSKPYTRSIRGSQSAEAQRRTQAAKRTAPSR
jgi:hypothetical protein